MSQKKIIDIWRRTEYLLITKHKRNRKLTVYRDFLDRCYQLDVEKKTE